MAVQVQRKGSSMRTSAILALGILMSFLPVTAIAGGVSGSLKDAAGQGIPGVPIIVQSINRSQPTGMQQVVVTDSNGQFQLDAELPKGIYKVQPIVSATPAATFTVGVETPTTDSDFRHFCESSGMELASCSTVLQPKPITEEALREGTANLGDLSINWGDAISE